MNFLALTPAGTLTASDDDASLVIRPSPGRKWRIRACDGLVLSREYDDDYVRARRLSAAVLTF